MKLSATLIIVAILQVSASSKAQNVSLNVRETRLEEVFRLLEKQTGYNFLFNSEVTKKAAPVSLSVKQQPLNTVLNNLLGRMNLSFVVEDRTVVIAAPRFVEKMVSQQLVSGVVSDTKGNTLPGVSVRLKGLNVSTMTDSRGSYRLNVPAGDHTLIFSFIGFRTSEVILGGRSTVNVSMEEVASNLEDVVVIGYGTVKRKDLTGAVSSVKAADIALSPVSSPMEALQGRVSGLDIQRESGRAGSTPSVVLRGDRSINGGGTPIYVIDGVIGNINSLNPNDIESIDVLKDASATAIYGVQGANGVIMVTTKKATSGKLQVDVNSYYGVNGFASFPQPLQGDAWISYMRDRYIAAQGGEPGSREDFLTKEQIELIDAGKWVNWVDETLKTGTQQNHFASIRGGTENTRAYLSLGYIGEKGIYLNDESKIFNTRTGADMAFGKIVKAGIQVIFSARNSDQTNSRINQSYSFVPLGDVYNPDGTINLRPLGPNTSNISPIANYQPGVWVDNGKNLSINLNPYVEVTPIENLTIRSNFGGSLGTSRSGQFQNERSYNLAAENRNTKIATYETGNNYGYMWETFANYNFTIKQDHSFSVLALLSLRQGRGETSTITGEGLEYDNYLFYNIAAARNIIGRGTSYRQTTGMAYGARLNYSYKGRYLLTATNRWDGASQLVNHWDTFPSIALGWRISDEPFMRGTGDWLNNLKLRLTYGITGNSDIDPYQGLTEVVSKTAGANLSLGGSSVLPIYVLKQALGNPDLRWERSKNTNLGLDMSFARGRLDVTADLYHTRTEGVHYRRNMPSTSGLYDAKNYYTKALNIATTENRGIELTLNSRNIIKKSFQWSTALTFTAAREKLLNIDLGGGQAAAQLISANLFPGYSLSTIYGYKKTGIWQLGEEEEALKYGAVPGDIKLATVPKIAADGSSDGGVHVYSAADRMIIGHRNPNWTMGLQNTLVYKGLDLTVFMHARYGQTLDAQLLGYWNRVAQPASYDYWMPSNPTNDFPRPGSAFSSNYQAALQYADGSYIKIKNITLGYTLPHSLAGKLAMSRLRVYGTAYNPLIYTRSRLLKNVDPETGGTDSFPLYKQIVFGVNLSF